MFTDGSPDRPRLPLWLAALGVAVAVAALATAAVILGARPSPPAASPTSPSTTAQQPVPPPTTPTPAPSTVTTPPSSAATTMVLPAPERHTASAADRDTVVAVTQRFVAGWLLPRNPQERAAALAGTATGDLVGLLAPVPAENLPAGPPPTAVEVAQISDLAATAMVVLSDGTRVRVELVNTAVGWQASAVERAGR